jgi:AhpD family alkylhydroperoxidase
MRLGVHDLGVRDRPTVFNSNQGEFCVARINFADWANDPSIADLVARIVQQRGQVGGLYALLLQSPPVMEGWLRMSSAVRQEGKLDGASRELAIIRVVETLGCQLEVKAHTPFALREGVTEQQLASLADWRQSNLFSERQCAILEYADTMTRDIKVPDAVFDSLRTHFDEREIVELTVTVGFYHLVARFIVAMDL